jgi:hypothetical protein
VTWIILLTCAQGLVGCGRSDSSHSPLTPSPLLPSAPPPRSRSLSVDLTGNYLLTFEAGSSCDRLPQELRTRTYEARIGYSSSTGTTDWFHAELSGALFHEWAHVVVIAVAGNSVRFHFSDNIIVEKPAPDTYLMIAGFDQATSVEPPNLSTISASSDGFFEYCLTTSYVRAGSHCPSDAKVGAACRSTDSRWTLTRR